MATSSITIVDQASGLEGASRTFSEDALTRHAQRYVYDSRITGVPRRYALTVSFALSATPGANLFGLRKMSANPTVRIFHMSMRRHWTANISADGATGLYRASSVAGGSPMTASDIPKLDSATDDATLEVRIGAVTGTKDQRAFFRFGGVSIVGTGSGGGGGGPDVMEMGMVGDAVPGFGRPDLSRAIVLAGDEGLILEQTLAASASSTAFLRIEWAEGD